MSDTPNNGSGDGSQGGQPQGGQPQGGQAPGGQPQGGQPQGGQAPQGQPGQGQPQQGQTQRAPVNTGPSIGDIFNRAETVAEMKIGVAVFALVGLGIGLGIFLNGAIANTTDPGYIVAAFSYLSTFVLPPLVAAGIAVRQHGELSELADNLTLATVAVTGFGGSLVMVLVSSFFAIIGLDTGTGGGFLSLPEIGDVFVPAILVAIGAAVTAVAIVWVLDNLGQNGGTATPPR